MKKYVKCMLTLCLCIVMILNSQNVFASDNAGSMARGTYMSSATAYAKISNEDDIIGNAYIICLAKVAEINVDMYLQRAYGNTWKNVTTAYNMNVTDTNILDEYAIVYNVSPGTYRVYIEVMVTGYDGLFDAVALGTGSVTVNT